jgi:two-component system chemotaxis sensor kinase CheA
VLVDQLVRDRRAFFDFWREANGLVNRIIAETGAEASVALRRDVHTLKGNSRFFGLSRLAKLCHKLEDSMQERGENLLNDAERHELGEAWGALRRRIEPLMHGATPFLQVSEEEYERLLHSFDAKVSVDKLREQLVGLRYEPTAWRLERAREMLFAACERLGKPRPEVEIKHHDLRLPPERWVPFWSVLPHLLNNAADHGLESADERSAAGKPANGVVKLETRLERDELIVELSDDGPGVDWDKVKATALARGLPADGAAELTRALLSDGFSLKAKVSETSGRGVGLAAVNAVVQALGGRIEIDSAPGRGTRWRIKFPGAGDRRDRAKPAAVVVP